VLRWIATAAPGSRLVFTYLHRGLIDGTVPFFGGELMMKEVRHRGEPWTFGLYPEAVAEFIGRFGLRLRENLGADEYRRQYLGGAAVNGYAFYRIAVADVAATPSA
jgi:O-methyltransferase involved in polyketide biosynthesis